MTEIDWDIANEVAMLLDRLEAEGADMREVAFSLLRYGTELIADAAYDYDRAAVECKRLIEFLREMPVRH